MKNLFDGQWFIQLSLAKRWGVIRRKNRYKESPAHYTEYKSTKDEKKTVFIFHLDLAKFIYTTDHLYDWHYYKWLGLKDKKVSAKTHTMNKEENK